MTLTLSNKIYPGLLCNGTEFFTVNGQGKFLNKGKIHDLDEMSYMMTELVKSHIKKDHEVTKSLKLMHPDNELMQVHQFLMCRYGGLDYKADIKNNQLQEGDYWDCPNRSKCAFNGIICKAPKYNGKSLSSLEVKLMKLLTSDKTNSAIADELHLPMGSFHKSKKLLYKKLGNVQTKQAVTKICDDLNLI